MIRTALISLCAALAVAACQAQPDARVEAEAPRPVYKGVETRLLDGDLVSFVVALQGVEGPRHVEDYAKCAAAQYTLIRGYSFARHVRTNVEQQGGLWSADAVYTISPDLPRGARTIDAETIVEACAENAIPTV